MPVFAKKQALKMKKQMVSYAKRCGKRPQLKDISVSFICLYGGKNDSLSRSIKRKNKKST